MRLLKSLPVVIAIALCLVSVTADAGSRRGQKQKKRRAPKELVIYRRSDCSLCDRLEILLKEWNVRYTVKNLSFHPEDSVTLHRECQARNLSCRGYPILEADGVPTETGPEMYALLRRINSGYSSYWDPLWNPSGGDGNAADRSRTSSSSYTDTGNVSTR